MALWQCHQTDRDHPASRLCAGWVGCHGDHLLALRLGLVAGEISPDTYRAAITYQSPTPLFNSGAQAAAHGRKHIKHPNRLARRLITKILRRRTDLTHSNPPPASSEPGTATEMPDPRRGSPARQPGAPARRAGSSDSAGEWLHHQP